MRYDAYQILIYSSEPWETDIIDCTLNAKKQFRRVKGCAQGHTAN